MSVISETFSKILAVLEENRELLKENRDLLIENRDLLIESRDLLKSTSSYFDERKRLDLAEGERLERADFDRKVNALIEEGNKALIEEGNKRIAKYLNRFVYEEGMILSSSTYYHRDNWSAIGCIDGVWFISEKAKFANPSNFNRSSGYASIELAFRAFLSRFK